MRILRTIFCYLCLFTYLESRAQDTLFYDVQGHQTKDRLMAHSYELSLLDYGAFKRLFLANGKLAMQGNRSAGKVEGRAIIYYENGKKKEACRFKEDHKLGDLSRWYSTGQKMGDFYRMYSERTDYEDFEHRKYDHDEKIISLFDTLGNALVSEGNGKAFEMDFLGNIVGEGEVNAGLKDGDWSGTLSSEEYELMTYSEQYSSGKLLGGISIDLNGNRFSYTELEIQSEYPGGLKPYFEFLGRNMKYPKQARRKGIQGRVYIQFTIEKDGALSDFEVIKGIGGGCDEEALRVLKMSKEWIPAKFRGQVIRSKLIQNILFKFS